MHSPTTIGRSMANHENHDLSDSVQSHDSCTFLLQLDSASGGPPTGSITTIDGDRKITFSGWIDLMKAIATLRETLQH
jgi:hypothetical protein